MFRRCDTTDRANRVRDRILFFSVAVCLMGCDRSIDDGRNQIGSLVFQEDQYMRLVQLGMQDSAKRFDVDLLVNNSFSSLDREIAIIDTYIVNGVDALVVTPLSAKSSIPELRHAHELGIVVVTVDTHLDADFPASQISSDQVDLGRKSGEVAARFIEKKFGGKAKLALVTTLGVSPEGGGQRLQGFQDAVSRIPGVEIVAQQDAWLAPEATNVVEGMLTANPEINLVWAANEGGTVGAVTGVVNRGLAGKVFVFGTDMSEQIGTFLLSDDEILQAVTGQKPFEIGQRAIIAATEALANKAIEKQTLLPGVLYSRDRPDEVREYVRFLQGVAK